MRAVPKSAYVRSGIRKYSIACLERHHLRATRQLRRLGWWSLVRSGLGLRFVLNVQVNGEKRRLRGRSEQVFENAREDVQSRINTAKSYAGRSLGASAAEDPSWDVYSDLLAWQSATRR